MGDILRKVEATILFLLKKVQMICCPAKLYVPLCIQKRFNHYE